MRHQLLGSRKLAIGVIFVLFSLYIPFIWKPITRDAGAFLTIAMGIKDGYLPYIDFFDMKPPMIYYTLAFAFSFGPDLLSARIVLFTTNIFTTFFIFKSATELSNRKAGIIAGILYFIGTLVYQGTSLLTEPFMMFFLTAGICVLIKDTSVEFSFIAGVLFGIGSLYKQPGVFSMFAGSMSLILTNIKFDRSQGQWVKAVDWPSLFSSISALGVGFGLPLVLVTGYFHQLGGLEPLIYHTLIVPLRYGGTSFLGGLFDNVTQLMEFPLVWVAAAVAIGIFPLTNKWDRDRWIIILFLISFAIPTILRQYTHYYLQPLAPASVVAGVIIDQLDRTITQNSNEEIYRFFVIVIVVLSIPAFASIGAGIYDVSSGSLSEQKKVAEVVIDESESQEKILVLSAQPQYYFLSNRYPPNQNIYFLPINWNATYSEQTILKLVQNRRVDVVVVSKPCLPTVNTVCEFVESNYSLVLESKREIQVHTRNPSE